MPSVGVADSRAMSSARSQQRTSRLTRTFYSGSTLSIARSLIGMHLVHRIGTQSRRGRIVETEAYLGPSDQAAHSARGRTPRTEVMFGPPGHAYVYLIYGLWYCLNVVTGAEGVPHAVLLRALEPIEGLTGRACGPGLLCRALGIDRQHNGLDLCADRLWIERPEVRRRVRIRCSERIGVDYAGAWAKRPWRFFDADSPFVSGRGAPTARR